MANIQDRMLRAAKLDVQLYEEVEHDEGALGQATTVVVLSAVAAGIGSLGIGGLTGLVSGTLAALFGWYVWAFLTYYIGTRLLPEPQTRADHGQLLRTIGFASAPGLIRVAGIIPGLGAIVFSVAGIWMLVATVIAVRSRSTLASAAASAKTSASSSELDARRLAPCRPVKATSPAANRLGMSVSPRRFGAHAAAAVVRRRHHRESIPNSRQRSWMFGKRSRRKSRRGG